MNNLIGASCHELTRDAGPMVAECKVVTQTRQTLELPSDGDVSRQG